MNKLIVVGSTYFFSKYPDFKSHDIDYVEVVDYPVEFKHYQQINLITKDIFRWVKLPVDEMIDFELKCDSGMQLGKYLVFEFCEAIGFTIDKLPRLAEMLPKLDEKHLYERFIYECYINNNSFTLTDEQRDKAYQMYKEERHA